MSSSQKHHPARLFLSCLGVGHLPKAPGTWASFLCLPFLYLLTIFPLSRAAYLFLLLLLLGLSIFLTDKIQKADQTHDPGWIVIDEVIGMMVAFLFSPYFSWSNFALLFIFFRFFDIIKIWPASYFDGRPEGWGTILDDVVSGIYAGIALKLCQPLLH